MDKRVITYYRQRSSQAIEQELCQAVEHSGDTVIAAYRDDGRIVGRGKFAGWHKLLANLNRADQVVVGNAGDLPGRAVSDLLKVLGTFQAHGVSLRLYREGIDTADGATAVLSLIAVFRAAKLSESIRHGQARAVAAGKRIGRPTVPASVQNRIRGALADGGGVRPTARRFKVSPAYVVKIRRTMTGTDMAACPLMVA